MTSNFQDLGHPSGWDYTHGSPHLKHTRLRLQIINELTAAVLGVLQKQRSCKILEIGAGHGSFTDHLIALGASVTIVEMSTGSAKFLTEKYAQNSAVNVIVDADGTGSVLPDGSMFDAVVAISVLHHIPDYVAAIALWVDHILPGGFFASFQDPLYYPRQRRSARAWQRAAFYVWRLFQGDLTEGLRSFRRRRRGLDESNSRDMIEYHVVREGCDELAIEGALSGNFENVRVIKWWSTQSAFLQAVGTRIGSKSEFGILASGRISKSPL